MTEPILQRVASGDPEAVRECIRRYGPLVWSLARRLCGSEAEDAVQDVFVDLWRSADRYDPAVASEPVFVATIARRRLIDRRRRAGRNAAAAAMEEAPTVMRREADRIEACSEAALAFRALSQLPPEQRQVLLLAACDGLSQSEIAELLRLPLGTVKAHARRGLERVRALLEGASGTEARP